MSDIIYAVVVVGLALALFLYSLLAELLRRP